MAPSTVAAPAMSVFIHSMPVAVLMLRPPASNVTPLPTSATEPRGLPSGRWVSFTKRGSWADPRLTPSRPPSFALRMAALSSTSISRPASVATRVASAANALGVRSPPGVLTRSRTSTIAVATAMPRSTAAAARAPPFATTWIAVSFVDSGAAL